MKLIKILQDKIQIKTDMFEFRDIKINSLMLVEDKSVSLVTMVTSLTDTDTRLADDEFLEMPEGIKVIECSIIGTLKDSKFKKAIDEYPTTNIDATEITPAQFKRMIGTNETSGFRIGDYPAYGCDAFVDGNKFFQRHACIVGNTGSGKSETVAKILEETSRLSGTNIVVLDIHGEYGGLSYAENIKIGKGFSFPVWLFGFSDMVSNILMVKEESSMVVMSALKKCYDNICPNGSVNKPHYFSYSLLINELELLNNEEVRTGDFYKTGEKAGQAKTVKGDFNGKLTSIINILRAKASDKKYSFLFKEENQDYLFELVNTIMGGNKPIKNIDLSEVPHDVAISIIGVITKLVYEIQKNGGSTSPRPITLVCDEAHIYIPNNFQLSASERRMVEIFENIAKEGRKFGFTLFPASQRPSELNKTIMAQCGNFIVSKLNNENDKSMIKGMLPDGNENLIESTTMFNPGDVLIVGDAVPIPLKIHVELASERPDSRTIDFWDEWKGSRQETYNEEIESYMR